MIVYFLRHAKTKAFAQTGKDYERELSEKGIQQTSDLASKLSTLNVQQIVCSSAKRAKQTIIPFVKNHPEIKVIYIDALYLASKKEWQNILSKYAASNVLFVGHNEGISAYINYLTDAEISLQTGTLIELESRFNDVEMWVKGTGSINWMYRPEI